MALPEGAVGWIHRLREAGCAVAVFGPDEMLDLGQHTAGQLEDHLVESGNSIIERWIAAHDNSLDADGLREKYGVDGHPSATISEWKDDVANRCTLLGYWEWLHAQLH